MNDNIVIRIAGDSDEEVKQEDDVTEPVQPMSYEALCDHLNTKCNHVIV